MTWYKGYLVPEDYYYFPDKGSYLVKLTNNEIIKATRSNGHWFGMWRWLRDEEVEQWTAL